jgi:hypothetical protein
LKGRHPEPLEHGPKVAPERLELSRPFCGHCGLNAARLPVCFRHGAIVTVGIWREIPQRVRVESNHRARLRRALLLSPELQTPGDGREPKPVRGRPTGLEPVLTRATTGRSVLLSYRLHAIGAHRRAGASGPMRSRTSISGSSDRRLYRISYRTRSSATSGDGGGRTRIPAVQTPRSPVELHPREESRTGIEPACDEGKNLAPCQSSHRPTSPRSPKRAAPESNRDRRGLKVPRLTSRPAAHKLRRQDSNLRPPR